MLKFKTLMIILFGLMPFTALSEQFHTNLVQIPILAEKKAQWEAMLNSPQGLAFTMQQKGFVLGETGYTTDPEGNVKWNAWAKWETREDYVTYVSSPERSEGSKFHTTLMSVLAGQPSVLWVE